MTALQPIEKTNLPNLSKAEESIISLTPEYWDVDTLKAGDFIKCFYLGSDEREHIDATTGEAKPMLRVLLAEQDEDGQIKVKESAATKLVGILTEKEKAGVIQAGKTPLKITYQGKVKNKTNSFSSASWDVRLLIVEGKA